MTAKLFNSFKQHIASAIIIRENEKLLAAYNLGAPYLYTLHKQQHPNIQMQEDYNKLHTSYKYNNILDKGIPLSILLADIRFIKYLEIYGKKIF